jgi:ketosteroid isomerase-like protein
MKTTSRAGKGWGAFALALVVLATATGCLRARPGAAPDVAAARADVERLLDDWHRAAAKADAAGYWSLLEADAVFIGTDAAERWSRDEFERLYRKHFEEGKAWTFVPRDRHVYVSAEGDLAWFDERLDTEKLGELRGSGVARRTTAGWRIAHYVLSVPVPNALLSELVLKIAASSH